MADQKIEDTTEKVPQTNQNTSDPSQQIVPPGSVKKSSNLKYYLFSIIFLVIIAGIYFFYARLLIPKTPSNTGTVQYVSGQPLNSVSIHIPNDTDIQRYPLAEFTVSMVNVNMNVFEGLTVYRGINLEPGLAESWTNPNPTTWIFKLRKGVKFQSGDPFTAEDVKYTIDQANASVNDAVPWVSQAMAARIASVKVIDNYTVELTTPEPDATLLQWLVYLGIVSENQVKRDGLNNAVGTGPYKIVSLSKTKAVLQANNNYWGGVPKTKVVIYKVIQDNNEAKEELENGNLDIITLNTQNNNNLMHKGFQFATFRTGDVNWISLDVNDAKSKYITGTDTNPFKDLRVRQAIRLAINIPEIIQNVGLYAEPVTQMATQELIGYNPQITNPTTDIAKAKKLLASAGYQNGFSVVFDVDEQPDHLKVAEQIKKELSAIGINLKIQVDDTNTYFNKLSDADFAMLFIYYYPDTLDSLDQLNTLFHTKTKSGSHGLWNVNDFSNPLVDETIDKAESTFDPAKRVQLTQQAQALVMQNLSSILLYTEDYQIISRNTISYKPSITDILFGFDISGTKKVN